MNSRNQALALVFALFCGAAPSAIAGGQTVDQVAFETVRGKIRSVGEESFVVMVGEQAKTIQINAETKYYLDDKEARKEQVLKTGTEVSAETNENGVATKVSARSAMAAMLETIRGKVRSVGEDSFIVMVGEEAKTIQYNAETKYFLDGKEARKEQVLKTGAEVSVDTNESGVATKVNGRTSLDAMVLETLRGKIRSVGEDSFVVMVADQAKTVQVNAETKYMLDGKEVRKEQVLKTGTEVSVETAEGGAATQVSARTSS